MARDKIRKPRRAINLNSLVNQIRFSIPLAADPLKRRGFIHVCWFDRSGKQRNYLAQVQNDMVQIPQAGTDGQTFNVPPNGEGMGRDQFGFPVGIWSHNDPVFIPIDPRLKPGALDSGSLYKTLEKSIWLLSDEEPALSPGMKRAIGWMVIFMALIGIAIVIGSSGEVLQKVIHRP